MIEQQATNESQSGLTRVSVHELRNLISVVIAEAQLLQMDSPEDNANYSSAVAIERAGRRMEVLVNWLTAAWDEALRESDVREPETGRYQGTRNSIEGAGRLEEWR
ncbi:MAG: hypothetical protein ACE5LU_20760 [Anaerolineae bacterium]